MLQKMNIMVKKTLLVLMITVLLGGSILPIQGTTHAQPPNNPNGAQAATIRWISELSFEILAMYLHRSLPVELFDIGFSWRNNEITDEDGKTKIPERQRLLRWDRRPPNEILINGFVPQVINADPSLEETNLFRYVKSNTKSIFVSTTKTKYKNGKRYQPWSPRTRDNGIVYQYEIFAPGGVDVNRSFGEQSPWPNQLEVAFPGGIRPEFIRSVRELQNGRIQRIWINPNFQDPGNLEGISASSSTEQVMWHPDHPDGNHKDPNVYSSTNSDEDMFGPNGDVPDEEELPIINNRIADGEYQIKTSLTQDMAATLNLDSSEVGSPHLVSSLNQRYDNQKWIFIYDNSKQAYKIKSRQKQDLVLSLAAEAAVIRGWKDNGEDRQYWRIESTNDGCYKVVSYANSKIVLDLDQSNTSNGTRIQGYLDNGSGAQKWAITPVMNQTIKDGEYQIKTSLDLNIVAGVSSDDNDVKLIENIRTDDEKWNFVYDSSKEAYVIKNAKNPELFLTMNRKEITVDEFSTYNQFWYVERTSDGYFKLRNADDPSLVIGLEAGSAENHNLLEGRPDTKEKDQRWAITPVMNQTIDDGEYEIKDGQNDIYLPELTSSNEVKSNEYNHGENQRWKFTFSPDKQAYKITSVSNPHVAFSWDSNNSNEIIGCEDQGFSDQYWYIEKTSDGLYKLRNYKDPSAVLDFGKIGQASVAYQGTKLILQRTDRPIIKDGMYNVSSKVDYEEVIDHDKDAAHLVNYDNNNCWEFVWNSDKKAYEIRSHRDSNQRLSTTGSGSPVIEKDELKRSADDLNAYWIIEYGIKGEGFLIRNLNHPEQLLRNSGGFLHVDYHDDDSENQLWNFLPHCFSKVLVDDNFENWDSSIFDNDGISTISNGSLILKKDSSLKSKEIKVEEGKYRVKLRNVSGGMCLDVNDNEGKDVTDLCTGRNNDEVVIDFNILSSTGLIFNLTSYGNSVEDSLDGFKLEQFKKFTDTK
ncbi:putative toxin [Paenibacillus phage Yyerffej]|uniref:Putative toxin n=1 Tax=Paenibacillus phage Yyerffej TaxID=2249780 RepID=A0A345ARR1_9CAUD|nr:toxin [Paenibacillus phage Yyerffej]AXF39515.1 putative toxin [Paenibacillus phage Yyerffej]